MAGVVRFASGLHPRIRRRTGRRAASPRIASNSLSELAPGRAERMARLASADAGHQASRQAGWLRLIPTTRIRRLCRRRRRGVDPSRSGVGRDLAGDLRRLAIIREEMAGAI